MSEDNSQAFGYLPVPDIVTRLGLYVTGAGTAVVPPKSKYPHQTHPELYDFTWKAGRTLPEFQFVLISEGKGEFESKATGLQAVEAGTVMQLFPDVWHRYRPDRDTGWTEYWISFGGELMFQWQSRGIFKEQFPLAKLRQPSDTRYQFERIVEVVKEQPEQSATLMTSRAMGVIAATLERHENLEVDGSEATPGISAQIESAGSGKLNETIVKAKRVIWNHSHRRLSVDMIAKEIGIKRRTLERHFSEYSNLTVLQELVACRIHRAKRLLIETHLPIKHIAHAAGFSSVSNLCKVFRRELDLTPGEYRDGMTGEDGLLESGDDLDSE